MSARISTPARPTLASTNARIDALADMVESLTKALAPLVAGDTPAKVTPARKPATKATKAPKAEPKATPVRKGAQTRETLTRKDWNRTLTARARFAGGDAYKRVTGSWDKAQALREAGKTPEQALALLTK